MITVNIYESCLGLEIHFLIINVDNTYGNEKHHSRRETAINVLSDISSTITNVSIVVNQCKGTSWTGARVATECVATSYIKVNGQDRYRDFIINISAAMCKSNF